MNALTKIFVVLQLVLALVLSVLVVQFIYKQDRYKGEVLAQQKTAIASAAALSAAERSNLVLRHNLLGANRLAARETRQLQTQILALQGKLSDDGITIAQLKAAQSAASTNVTLLTNTVNSLNKQVADQTTQLNRLRPSELKYINENAQLNRRNDELTNQRDAAEKTIQTLQESVAALTKKIRQAMSTAMASKGPGTSASLTAMMGVPTSVLVNGTVRNVRVFNGHTYVSTTLGDKDGVTKGTRLTIYNGQKYIGDVIVQQSDATESIGMVTLVAPGAKVAVDEMVMSGPGS